MKYKKGDLVKRVGGPRSFSSMRGVVVEANEKYDFRHQDFRHQDGEPFYRVLWAAHHQPAWHYEEDICSVG